MRCLLAALLLVSAGCSKKAPPVTDRSAWWAPLAAWNAPNVTAEVAILLDSRGIGFFYTGSRGERIAVPWERHAEAAGLLRGSTVAAQLGIHRLLAGPRPGAELPKVDVGGDRGTWRALASFTLAELPVERLQAALNPENIECGVIVYSWAPELGRLYVPEASAPLARRILDKGPFLSLNLDPRPP